MLNEQHPMLHRFNTGDGSEHSNFILTRFDYARRPRDPVLVSEYVERLSHIPVQELRVVFADLQNPERFNVAVLPSIEAILHRHKERKAVQNQKRREAEEQKQIDERKKKPSDGERYYAKRATNAYFGALVLRGSKYAEALPKTNYQGQFPFKEVAEGVELPDPEETNHKVYWQALWDAFDVAWEEYAA